MDPRIEKDFLRPDIENLPIEYVRDWFSGAVAEEMPKAVWGYLLPRILELLAAGEEPATVGVEVSLSRFPTGDQGRWSTEEWAVLDRFQREFLAARSLPNGCMLDDILCMFGNAAFPLEDLISQVETWSDDALVRRLWADWCEWPTSPQIWLTSFWDEPHIGKTWAWYTSESLYERLLTFACSDGTPGELSAKALQIADTIRINADWSAE